MAKFLIGFLKDGSGNNMMDGLWGRRKQMSLERQVQCLLQQSRQEDGEEMKSRLVQGIFRGLNYESFTSIDQWE